MGRLVEHRIYYPREWFPFMNAKRGIRASTVAE
jgi:hypothetical protein